MKYGKRVTCIMNFLLHYFLMSRR